MENRLFLLQEPGQDFDALKNEILAGNDVTPETEFSGKVTLTQLNAYSGELKAEALSNFKTIKIEKDGSAIETNLAKLLIELQQGGGADDAREEGDIKIASVEDDMAIRGDLALLSTDVKKYHDVYSPVAVDGKYELASASDAEIKRWAASQAADGSRTRFVAEDGISFGSDIHAVLNGVIVTPEDGNIIMAGEYAMGFEFAVAPTVGDVVEFFVSRVLGKAEAPYQEAIAANESAEAAAIDAFALWEAARNTEIAEFNAELTKANEKKNTVQLEHADAKAAVEAARKAYADATSVDDINKAAGDLVDAIKVEADLSRTLISVDGDISAFTAKIAAANESMNSEQAEREKAAADFTASRAEMENAIAMFNDIKQEHDAIVNPPLA
jgi:hypothetical protein